MEPGLGANKSIETRIAQLRGRRWSEADARVVIEALERSGEVVSAFARQYGLDAQRLYKWRSRLSDEVRGDAVESKALSFAPVVVTGLGRAPVVVVRIGEIEIEVHEPLRVDPSWLAQMIAATRSA